MDSNEAATVFLKRGKHTEEFSEPHARRILDLQKRMGVTDFKEVTADESAAEAPPATEPQTDSQNALTGPTGDSVNPDTEKRSGTKKGG